MRNVEPGFRVVGSDGNEIGTVANCSREYCEVSTGILGLGHPLYVPMDAIRQTEGNTVFLNVSSERISELNWSHPPAGGRETCATSYYGTMPAGPTSQAQPSSQQASPPSAQQAPPTPAPGTPTAIPGVYEVTPSTLESVGFGWPIICSEGRQVGTVVSARPDGLVMDRGWFVFRHTVLVPASTIEHIDDIHHRVYLAADCAAVNRFRSV